MQQGPADICLKAMHEGESRVSGKQWQTPIAVRVDCSDRMGLGEGREITNSGKILQTVIKHQTGYTA
jgi:hypothetical protein